MRIHALFTGMALTGVLLSVPSVVKADAYMELISGSSTVQVTGPLGLNGGNFDGVFGNGALFIGDVGTWKVDIAAGGNLPGGFNVTLTDVVNSPNAQAQGLEVIFSSGSYPLSGSYVFGASDAGGNSLTATVSGYDSSALYTGTGSMGTSLGSFTLGTTYAQSFQTSPVLMSGTQYITETLLFGGTTGTLPGQPGPVTMNATASFVDPPDVNEVAVVPDGGMTLTMAGLALAGLAGLRSKFGV
jgi:hypothetical protein